MLAACAIVLVSSSYDGKSLGVKLNFLPASVDAVCLTFLTPVGLCPSQQFPDDEVSSGVVPLPLLHNFTFITAMYLWKRGRTSEGGAGKAGGN